MLNNQDSYLYSVDTCPVCHEKLDTIYYGEKPGDVDWILCDICEHQLAGERRAEEEFEAAERQLMEDTDFREEARWGQYENSMSPPIREAMRPR